MLPALPTKCYTWKLEPPFDYVCNGCSQDLEISLNKAPSNTKCDNHSHMEYMCALFSSTWHYQISIHNHKQSSTFIYLTDHHWLGIARVGNSSLGLLGQFNLYGKAGTSSLGEGVFCGHMFFVVIIIIKLFWTLCAEASKNANQTAHRYTNGEHWT